MRAFRLNLLCLVGGAIGVAAIFIPSVSVTTAGMNGLVTSTKNLGGIALVDYLLAVPVMLFILGAVLAFLTPIGGIFQATGLGVMSCTLLVGHWPYNEFHPSYGLGLAFASCIFVLLSFRYSVLAVHVGPNTDRLLTVVPASEGSSISSSGGDAGVRVGSRLARLNLLCFVGAVAGLLSFVMSWVTMFPPFGISPEFGGFVLGAPTWEYVAGTAGLVAALYVLGAIISFASPLGGILQVASSFSFFLVLRSRLEASTIISGQSAYNISLNLGFYVALFAGLLVLASIVIQHLLPTRFKFFSSSKWFWTWSSEGPTSSAADPSVGEYKINVLSLCGSLVGVVALFGAWMSVGFHLTDPLPYGHATFTATLLWQGNTLVGLGALLFLAGTALSIGSQFGGGLQVVGLACFLIGARGDASYWASSIGSELGIGLFLASASAALVIAGALRPVWFATRRKKVDWFDRLLVPGGIVAGGSGSPGPRFGSNLWIALSARWEKRLRLNLTCIIGAVLGIISLSFNWSHLPNGLLQSLVSYITMDPMSKVTLSPDMAIPLLFLLGCLVSFITPLGGILQVGACIAFYFRFNEIYRMYGPNGIPWAPGLGFSLGLFSGIIVLLSPLYIVGPGNWGQGPRGIGRLFAWGTRPSEASDLGSSEDETHGPATSS